MRRTVVIVVIGMLVAGACWAWVAATTGIGIPGAGERRGPTAMQSAPASASAPSTTSAETPPQRGDASPVDAREPVCIVRGRCVDSRGAPIAGVNAVLKSSPGGALVSVLKGATSDAAGNFELRTAPTTLPCSLTFGGPARTAGVWQWDQLRDETILLGDIVLARATRVRGRVVSADGVPAADVELRIRDWNWKPVDQWSRSSEVKAAEDGTFSFQEFLPAGDYGLDAADRLVTSPQRITLAGEAERWLDVVLRAVTAADSLSGLVVDDAGDPVSGVRLMPISVDPWRGTYTDASGAFRIVRQRGEPDAVHIDLHADGYEAPPVDEAFAWGRDDLRFVLLRGHRLEVQVVRSSDGAPVEHYTLRVDPVRTSGSVSTNDMRVRGGPHHENGREVVRGLRTGTHRILVAPADDSLATAVVPVELSTSEPSSVIVRLAPAVLRSVRVQRRDGSAVVATKVQLIDALGRDLDLGSAARSLADWTMLHPGRVLLLAEGETDASGEVSLRVPTDRASGLLVTGSAHAPTAVPVADFPAGGPLLVTVRDGAVLRGSVGPPEVLVELDRLALTSSGRRLVEPRVFLVGTEPHAPREFPERGSGNHLAEDGSFELVGVPAGRWGVMVEWSSRVGGVLQREPAGEVSLEEGVTTTLAIDLARILPGELEAQVFLNGEPLGDHTVGIRANLGPDASGEPRFHGQQVVTDAQGRFRATLRAGDYELLWARSLIDSPRLHARERASVECGKLTQQTFSLQSGTVVLRLLDIAGAPVASTRLWVQEGARERLNLPRTDADGVIRFECDVGTYTVAVLPRRLQDDAQRVSFVREHAGDADPTARVRVPLGTLTVLMGETTDVAVKLPADW